MDNPKLFTKEKFEYQTVGGNSERKHEMSLFIKKDPSSILEIL